MSYLNDVVRSVNDAELRQMNLDDNEHVVIITGLNRFEDEYPDWFDFNGLVDTLQSNNVEYSIFNFGIEYGEQVNTIFHRAFECILHAYIEDKTVLVTGPEEATNNTLVFTARAEIAGKKFWPALLESDLSVPPLHRMYAKNILWNVELEREERMKIEAEN